MNKLINLCLFFFFSEVMLSQTTGIEFYFDGSNKFFLDTTSVKRISNLITCRINVIKTRTGKTGNKYFAGSSVRQYLLNSAENNYFVLGEIEYDSSYGVINSGVSQVVNPKIPIKIKADSVAFNLARYFNLFFREEVFVLQEASVENLISEKTEISKTEGVDTVDKIQTEVKPDTTNIIETDIEKGNEISFSEESAKITPFTYDFENEINPEGTIFTDGRFYCFQVSSWKNLTVAENEAGKLINKGFNAFIVKVNLSGKKGVWYRVRIGYFNSLDEARENQKKVSAK